MTNPDHEELMELADQLTAQDYGNVSDVDVMGEHFALLAKAATALRRLASSDSGVKGEPVAWRDGAPPKPWADEWWKPKDTRRNLVKAGALIVAEIERLDRLEGPRP